MKKSERNPKRTFVWLIAVLALVGLAGITYQAHLVSAQTQGTHIMPDGSVMSNDEGTMSGGHMRGMGGMMREHMRDMSDEDVRAMHKDCMKMMQDDDE